MTAFKQNKAIYLQLVERLCDDIIAGRYKEEDRIPSVREFAVLVEVNTNTVVKAYEQLSLSGIIYTKRGLGYFVSPHAREQIIKSRKENFLKEDLPELFRQMQLLDIPIEEVIQVWGKHSEP